MKKLLTLMILLKAMSLYSQVYYVATNGNDGWTGGFADPWETIQKAANTLTAGETVYIRGGTYKEKVACANSGTPGNHITYSAYLNEKVTIDGDGINIPWDGLFDFNGRDYIKVTNLRVIKSDCFGFGAWGSSIGIIVTHCFTSNTVRSGIVFYQCSNIIIDNNEVRLACNDGDWECISVAQTADFEIKNNSVLQGGPGNNGGEGIDVKDGSRNGKVYNNHVYDLNKIGIYVDAWDKWQYNIEVYNNLVHDCEYGIAVVSEEGGLLDDIRIFNNIAYRVYCGISIGDYGLGSYHPMRNIKVINNTLYDCGLGTWGGGIYCNNEEATNVIIRNNICSMGKSFQIAIDHPVVNLTVDYNLIYSYKGYATETRGVNYVEADPKFVNPSVGDFYLQDISSAINNGTSTYAPTFDYAYKPRPYGAGHDIGAYEFVGVLPGMQNEEASPSVITNDKVNTVTFTATAIIAGSSTITNVTINLSSIGGSANTKMTNIGGFNWRYTYNVPITTSGGKNLAVTAMANNGEEGYGNIALAVISSIQIENITITPSIATNTTDTSVVFKCKAKANITSVTLNLISVGGSRVAMTNKGGFTNWQYTFTVRSSFGVSPGNKQIIFKATDSIADYKEAESILLVVQPSGPPVPWDIKGISYLSWNIGEYEGINSEDALSKLKTKEAN